MFLLLFPYFLSDTFSNKNKVVCNHCFILHTNPLQKSAYTIHYLVWIFEVHYRWMFWTICILSICNSILVDLNCEQYQKQYSRRPTLCSAYARVISNSYPVLSIISSTLLEFHCDQYLQEFFSVQYQSQYCVRDRNKKGQGITRGTACTGVNKGVQTVRSESVVWLWSLSMFRLFIGPYYGVSKARTTKSKPFTF